MSQKKKILIIGSSGNIGRSLCQKFSKKNYFVHGISKKRNYRGKNFKNFNFDYRNNKKLKNFLKNKFYDLVINLIIYKRSQVLREHGFFKNKTDLYIFVSSTSIYNETNDKISEKSKARDLRWPVAKNKFFCEKVFFDLFKKKNFPVMIIRSGHVYNYFTVPSNIIGLGRNLIELLKSNKPAIIFKKNVKRSIIHSKDFANILTKLVISNNDFKGKILNISGNKIISWEKIYKLYFKFLKIKPKFQYIDTSKVLNINKDIYYALKGDRNKNIIFDNSNLRKYIKNYKEEISLEQGIKQIIKYQSKLKDSQKNRKIEKIYDSLIN